MSGPLLAAFLSGLAWAGLDVARKSLARNAAPVVIAACLSLGLAVLFGGWVLLAPSTLTLSAYLQPAAVSTALSLVVQVSILEAVRRGALSRTIPLLSLTPVATALFGLLVLGEQPTPRQWAGIVLVFAGAAALGLSRGTDPAGGAGPRFRFDKGALIMLVAAVCISAAAPFDKLAIAASSPALHGLLQSAVSAALLLVLLTWRGELSRVVSLFRGRPAMTGAAWLVFAALGLQFVAYQGVMVGAVETIKRVVGLVSSLVAGRLIFGETITWNRLIDVALMAIGVTLLLS